MNNSPRIFFLFFIHLLFFSSQAHACNVPIFRYALERWTADPYQITLFYKDSTQIRSLKQSLLQSQLNADYQFVDITNAENSRYHKTLSLKELPWISVEFPDQSPVQGRLWQGPAAQNHLSRLIESPVRTSIGESLLAGDAAVWILLKSGDAQKDHKARHILRQTLESAEQELEISSSGVDIDGNPITVNDFQDYEIRFSSVDIEHGSLHEVILRRILRHSEPGLANIQAPLAFPVFGRGRALYALAGAGINRQTIMEACQSIIGWCSCEVKALHPGLDLLMAIDWSDPAGGQMVTDDTPSPITGLEGFLSGDSAPATASGTPENAVQHPLFSFFNNTITRNLLMIFGLLLIILGYVTYRIKTHPKKKEKIRETEQP